MEISSSKDAEYVLATGDIVASDAPRLRELLARGDFAGKWLILSSNGGSVRTALDLGRLVRRWNLKTMVPPRGDCFSACLLIFLGGEERQVRDGGRLGSHQFRWSEDDQTSAPQRAADAQELSGKILHHFLSLGASPEALVPVMSAPANEMHVFSAYELERYKLVGTFHAQEAPSTVLGEGPHREGCPFPEEYIAPDPLRLYTTCY